MAVINMLPQNSGGGIKGLNYQEGGGPIYQRQRTIENTYENCIVIVAGGVNGNSTGLTVEYTQKPDFYETHGGSYHAIWIGYYKKLNAGAGFDITRINGNGFTFYCVYTLD